MSDLLIARRYALALGESAGEKGVTDRIDDDVLLIRESLDASSELERFFESPVIPREKKAVVVRELFAERVDAVMLDFLLLLVGKRREGMIRRILSAYHGLRDEQLGMVSVVARSARSIGAEEEARLTETVAGITGRKVRLETQVDESLMGGIVIRVGDTVFDGSVTNKLAALRERLRAGASLGG
jgi:F-type H+-transporting ATPase subunit delta